MRAALIQELAAPPVLAEMPDPERGPGDALVRITAACLNPVEVHINSGRFFDGPPRLPYVPGVEATGAVEEGEALAPGTRVRVEFVHPGYGRDGAIAEYAVAPETPDDADRRSQAMVFPLPDGVDDVAGAALGTSAYTALMVLERAVDAGARLQGAHVLVLAATERSGAAPCSSRGCSGRPGSSRPGATPRGWSGRWSWAPTPRCRSTAVSPRPTWRDGSSTRPTAGSTCRSSRCGASRRARPWRP